MTNPGAGEGPGAGRAPSLEEALTALVADAGLLGRVWPSWPERLAATSLTPPPTLLLDGRQLVALRERLVDGDDRSAQLRQAVQALGDAAAADEPSYVVDKPAPGPSGDVHDYVSLARYWWPNPESADGLPYVRREGETNPACRSDDVDAGRLARFSDGVLALAVTGYVLAEPGWTALARDRLLGWLVDPRTRQTPHFAYAQQVPGRVDPRPPVVVDARRMLAVAEAFRLVRAEGVLRAGDEGAIRQWFADLLAWLVDSPAARAAADMHNNVAAWCLLERAVLADLVGEEDILAASLADAGPLLARQVEVDGSMSAELVRGNPADYTAFAFVAMALLARVGQERGVPLWETAAADGRGLAAARDWLAALGGGGADPASQPVTVALAMRLLAWREETYAEAVTRAAVLAEEVRRRDRRITRLAEENERLRQEPGGRRGRQARRTPRALVPGRTLSPWETLRVRAAGWPVIGPAGRQVTRFAREHQVSPTGSPPAAARGLSQRDEQRLADAYRASDLADRPVRLVLYRILGNDLPPRHAAGQTLANLRFILEHEPPLPGCEKRWVLNRISDPAAERELADLLAEHDQPVLRIAFDWTAYAAEPFELDRLPRPDYLTTPRWDVSREEQRARAVSAAYRRKNLYAMNNNGARNTALADGRRRATWVLPFDGSTFFTEDGWAALCDAVRARPYLPYVVVPMSRVADNTVLLDGSALSPADEEPQVAFRADAVEQFDEQRPYGRRPKVDLLWRLGVPGPWEHWPRDPWDAPFPQPAPDHGRFQIAGHVVRLAAGSTVPDLPGSAGLRDRGLTREAALVAHLRELDGQLARDALATTGLTFYDDTLLSRLADGDLPGGRAAILAEAQAALLRGPYAVTDKTTLPPSGDPHDYWHPAPYWWPDPTRRDGLPYVHRDGQRVPGSDLFSVASTQFDRTRLQLMLGDVTSLALAWRVTGDAMFARHATGHVRTWFLDERTAMNPHLRYAQVRRGHDDDRGQPAGIIELKDLYYFLDAVRLLERSGCLTPDDSARLASWLTDYLRWLRTSDQGRRECLATNNHGTCYDLQVMAVAAYLADGVEFAEACLRATGRLATQFDRSGAQPEELARTQTRHYCAFNLTSWANLGRLAQAGGHDLWSRPDGGTGPIAGGLDWYLAMLAGDGWPFPQHETFDPRRDLPLTALERMLDEPSRQPIVVAEEAAGSVAPWVFHPHDGIAPFWPLALGPRRPDVSGTTVRPAEREDVRR